MKTTSMRVDEDLAALRRDLCRLSADVAELPNRIRLYGREKIMKSRERLRAAVTGLGTRAKDHVRGTSDVLKDQGACAMDKWRSQVEHRPIASVAVAFVAGWLVASLVERRWH
jgi:ElaB/YqjD/DUF883 family membrane-anchored ribosome-binding protein